MLWEISEEDYIAKICQLENKQDLEFFIVKADKKIRISNMSAAEIAFKEIYLDGKNAFDSGGKIAAKSHADFDIKGDLIEKETYLVRLTIGSGKIIKGIAYAA